MRAVPQGFADRVVHWQAQHGRQHLPWQQTRDPYRVWLSEIMLQQTQVATVLAYYSVFLQRFPTVFTLAHATTDEVMALWSGLGYYSRARNLHRCAKMVVEQYGGVFPASAQLLQTLAGIGPSTAAAIAAFCHGERVSILDANVQRVLTRVLGFSADLSLAANQRELWALAQGLLPKENLAENMPRYTQGLMDLGAMLCKPRNPQCGHCPLQPGCQAFASNAVGSFPVKTRKLKRRAVSFWLLWARRSDGAVWLCRRPHTGVWSDLYCFPVFETEAALVHSLGVRAGKKAVFAPAFVHALTHLDLHLHPVSVAWTGTAPVAPQGAWHDPQEAIHQLGLPAPVRKLLDSDHS